MLPLMHILILRKLADVERRGLWWEWADNRAAVAIASPGTHQALSIQLTQRSLEVVECLHPRHGLRHLHLLSVCGFVLRVVGMKTLDLTPMCLPANSLTGFERRLLIESNPEGYVSSMTGSKSIHLEG